MAKTRTFVGVAVPPTAGREILAAADLLKPVAAGVRWVPLENLHITLRFLGDLTDQEVVEVCSSVLTSAAQLEPFSVELAGAGAFPDAERPRALWIGAGAGQDELIQLQSAVDEAVTALGHRGENRRYVPHVTIGKAGRSPGARSAELSQRLQELVDFSAGTIPIAEVTVYASELHREGPAYHVLARCPLGG